MFRRNEGNLNAYFAAHFDDDDDDDDDEIPFMFFTRNCVTRGQKSDPID